MKRMLSTIAAVLLSSIVFSQWTEYQMTYDGLEREYQIYTPANLTEHPKVVMILHGLGASMHDFDNSTWPSIADTANIVLISPQGLPYELPFVGTEIEGVFNSGMVIEIPILGGEDEVNGEIDDIGFLNALLDIAIDEYGADKDRMYVTGFSNGGFMTQRCALEMQNRFAAAASVAGTRSTHLPASTNYFPIAHFHGDADSTVTLDGYVAMEGGFGQNLGVSVETLLEDWKSANGVVSSEASQLGEDTDAYWADREQFFNEEGKSVVEYYLLHNAEHQYSFPFGTAFNIAVESWKFFNQQVGATANVENENQVKFAVYPNPAKDIVYIEGDWDDSYKMWLFDTNGKVVGKWEKVEQTIDISELERGSYLLRISDGATNGTTVKLQKQ